MTEKDKIDTAEYNRLVSIAKEGDEARAKLTLLDCKNRTPLGWYMVERAKLFRLQDAVELQNEIFVAIVEKYKDNWSIHQTLKYEQQYCYGDEWCDEEDADKDYWAHESVQRLASIVATGTYFAEHCSGPDYLTDLIEDEDEDAFTCAATPAKSMPVCKES
jgi:hypothetical protein